MRPSTNTGRPAIPPSQRGLATDVLISIVVPVFNEEESLIPFLDAIGPAFAAEGSNVEVVFVNDGSRDKTLERLVGLCQGRRDIRVVNLSRNFGKEAALTAGIDFAQGDVVIPMDVDLQDPPELIPVFLAKWREGFDVVYGVRASRGQDSTSKRVTAGAFYRIFNKLSPISIPENTGDFRLIDRRVVEALRQIPERNRFMKGLFSWVGFPSIGVPYERPPRFAGTTKFNYWRLWNFALDGLIGFSTIPLRIWTYVGAAIALFSFLYAAIVIFRTLILGVDVPGYSSLMTVVLFLGGIQLLSLGVLGEYVGRLFSETKSRPIYLVENVYGSRDEPSDSVLRASV